LTALRRPIFTTRPAQRHAPAVERLAEMLAIRRQLSTEKVAPENASRLLENPMLQRLSRRRIARLTADIDALDKHLVEIVASDAALGRKRHRLGDGLDHLGALASRAGLQHRLNRLNPPLQILIRHALDPTAVGDFEFTGNQ
jgi:hypothetical protein